MIHLVEHDLIEFDIVLFEQFLGFGAVGTIGRREHSRLLLIKQFQKRLRVLLLARRTERSG